MATPKPTFFVIIMMLAIFCFSSANAQQTSKIGNGQMPAMVMDQSGVLNVVYGREDSLWFSSSADKGGTFSAPKLITILPGLASSHTRGPQIAATANGLVVTAANDEGNIFSYTKKQQQWTRAARVNDADTIAKEGLMSLSADKQNAFAVWLDVRGNRRNKIYGAASFDGGKTWSKNIPVYISPGKTVCECCKPSVLVSGNKVFVMFRNILKGNRDLYLIQSGDMGKHWGKAEKLGTGNWKLNGCPMDGGAFAMTGKSEVTTIWRREGKIYTATPGKPEQLVGEGKGCIIDAISGKQYFAWIENGEIVITDEGGSKKVLGKGSQPSIKVIDQKHLVCVYTKDEQVMATVVDI
ncbi:MAG: glycoside hydrolase [Chitinophagaceae bacterium]|nr:glycoside hydrolase [Chitinophagaceae bacterium]